MEFVDIALLKELLKYGMYAVGWGCVVIIPIELFIYAVVKAFNLIRNMN